MKFQNPAHRDVSNLSLGPAVWPVLNLEMVTAEPLGSLAPPGRTHALFLAVLILPPAHHLSGPGHHPVTVILNSHHLRPALLGLAP